MSRSKPGEQLARALSNARKAARPVARTIYGGKRPDGSPWFYADSDDILNEAFDLLNANDLEIRFQRELITERGDVQVVYAVLHLPSMERDRCVWTEPPMSEEPTGVAQTVEHSRRAVYQHVLGIRTVKAPEVLQAFRKGEEDRRRIATELNLPRRSHSGVTSRAPAAVSSGGPPGELVTSYDADEDLIRADNALINWRDRGVPVRRWPSWLPGIPQNLKGCSVQLRFVDGSECVVIVENPAPEIGAGGGLEHPGLLGGEDCQ